MDGRGTYSCGEGFGASTATNKKRRKEIQLKQTTTVTGQEDTPTPHAHTNNTHAHRAYTSRGRTAPFSLLPSAIPILSYPIRSCSPSHPRFSRRKWIQPIWTRGQHATHTCEAEAEAEAWVYFGPVLPFHVCIDWIGAIDGQWRQHDTPHRTAHMTTTHARNSHTLDRFYDVRVSVRVVLPLLLLVLRRLTVTRSVVTAAAAAAVSMAAHRQRTSPSQPEQPHNTRHRRTRTHNNIDNISTLRHRRLSQSVHLHRPHRRVHHHHRHRLRGQQRRLHRQ